MILFLIFLLVIVFVAALPPIRWSVRIWLGLAMLLGTFFMMQPVIPLDERGHLDGLAEGGIIALFTALSVGVGLRVFFEIAMPRPSVSSEERQILGWLDFALAGFAGICAGRFLVLGLAIELRGTPGGIVLHLILFAVLAAAAVAVLQYTRHVVAVAISAALGVMALMALAGGLYWPQLVQDRAAAIGRDLPRCIRALDRIAKPDDMMLLTMPHGRPGAPGLVLTVMYPDGPRHFRWSYRGMSFKSYGAYEYGACP